MKSVVLCGLPPKHEHFAYMGTYKNQNEKLNGKHVFKHKKNSAYIWWSLVGVRWVVGPEIFKGTEIGAIRTCDKTQKKFTCKL